MAFIVPPAIQFWKANSMSINTLVRGYWENGACGTDSDIVEGTSTRSPEWFERIEQHRYTVEPCIHSVAQFTRHNGNKVLEVGVGAGTDHLQWARAGAECYGVDLTEEAIETTRTHLALHGFESNLQRIDAEQLPFEDNMFDVVYSWGVIHHSDAPEKIIAEILRVLKPGGRFIGMMYGRYSLATLRVWMKNALLKGKPWRSFSDVLYHHVESIGTKAYTVRELAKLFSGFRALSAQKIITYYDKKRIPSFISRILPDDLGWFVALRATK